MNKVAMVCRILIINALMTKVARYTKILARENLGELNVIYQYVPSPIPVKFIFHSVTNKIFTHIGIFFFAHKARLCNYIR